MSGKIKSYKLSPQLKAELNVSQKRTRPNVSWFEVFPKIKIPWRAVLFTFVIFALVCGAYWGVKKTYEHVAWQQEQAKVAREQANQQRVVDMKKEVASKELDAYSFAELSQRYLKDGDGERAEAAAEMATIKDTSWRDGFLNLGQVYLSVNKFEQAKTAIEKAIKLDPLYGQAHYFLSLTLQELKQNDTAKEEFAKAKQFGFDTEIGGY